MITLEGDDRTQCLALREAAHADMSEANLEALRVFRLEMLTKFSLDDQHHLDAKCAILFSSAERAQGIRSLHDHG